MAKDVEHILKCLSAILNSSIENSLFISIIGLFGVLVTSFLNFFVYFGNQPSVRCGVGEDLFLVCGLLFCLVDCVLCLTEASQFEEVSFNC